MAQLFTFDDGGIKFLGFQEIRKAIKDDWMATFGQEIDLSETSPDGHHVDLEVKTIDSVTQMLKSIVSNMNRNSASGEYLDFLAAFLGLKRGDGETDESLRSRMDAANVQGLATGDGMLTYLRDKVSPMVGLAINDEPNANDDGIPGHSFRVTVPTGYSHSDSEGNDDTANHVAQSIWECKPAGIRSSGNRSGTATAASGQEFTMRYSVPENVDILVSVEISIYGEEAYPGDATVQEKLLAFSKSEFSPGKDVIPFRLGASLLGIPGIKDAAVKVKKATDSDWTSSPIPISSEQTAVIPDASSITVVSA